MRKNLLRTAVLISALGAGIGYWTVTGRSENDPSAAVDTASTLGGAIVAVTLPEQLSPQAKIGETAFLEKCAACHGVAGSGTEGIAPPLVHKIYEPSHHGDASFERAAQNGVTSHHWPFGDMPPVDGVTRGDVKNIIAYVRQVQRANGIH